VNQQENKLPCDVAPSVNDKALKKSDHLEEGVSVLKSDDKQQL